MTETRGLTFHPLVSVDLLAFDFRLWRGDNIAGRRIAFFPRIRALREFTEASTI
jgi:hypothetical protein